jgi:hypothetical protein
LQWFDLDGALTPNHLRSNLIETDPLKVWNYYLQLVRIDEALRTLKSDLAIRPIFH